jgi:hypothetical protein
LEEEGLQNGAGVDFKHQKRIINTPENLSQIILTCCSGVSVGRKRASEWSQCVFSCEVEGFSLEEEGLENGDWVDFKH